ncbi:MAG TPA: hypothetical protein VN088_16470 [Nocardioides sp.]|nr:hypothetical protein [Nocardioides sp.]
MMQLRGRALPLTVGAIALVAALLRIPFLGYPATIDDGGFYQVAQSWLHGGPNLYGQYWVDRPPGLIGLFAIAAGTGHFVVIRLIALAAAVVVILAVARAVHLLGGSPIWAAVVAASLSLTPLFGAQLDPGELLASAFTSVAFLAAVESRRTTGARALQLAGAAGLVAVVGASMKQNFVDGMVAVGIVLVADALRRTGPGRQPILPLLTAAGGAAVGLLSIVVVSAVAMTGPAALFDAVVTFRIDARSVLSQSPGARLAGRLAALNHRAVTSGLAGLLLALIVAGARRIRQPSPEGLAVAAAATVSIAAIVAGGGGWSHYLIGPTVWVAIGAGLAGGRILTRAAVVFVALSCAIALIGAFHEGAPRNLIDARTVGLTIHDAAQPGDTAITLYGVADVQFYTGLPSPYEYLWSLPMWVRDHGLSELEAVVAGSSAPTWIVQTNEINFQGPVRAPLGRLVASRYRRVSSGCGNRIWLLDGQDRPIPRRFSCRPHSSRAGTAAPRRARGARRVAKALSAGSGSRPAGSLRAAGPADTSSRRTPRPARPSDGSPRRSAEIPHSPSPTRRPRSSPTRDRGAAPARTALGSRPTPTTPSSARAGC